eukprot:COSAG02_NODE_245_length_27293_cov_16.488012_16_plen_231_part_00
MKHFRWWIAASYLCFFCGNFSFFWQIVAVDEIVLPRYDPGNFYNDTSKAIVETFHVDRQRIPIGAGMIHAGLIRSKSYTFGCMLLGFGAPMMITLWMVKKRWCCDWCCCDCVDTDHTSVDLGASANSTLTQQCATTFDEHKDKLKAAGVDLALLVAVDDDMVRRRQSCEAPFVLCVRVCVRAPIEYRDAKQIVHCDLQLLSMELEKVGVVSPGDRLKIIRHVAEERTRAS